MKASQSTRWSVPAVIVLRDLGRSDGIDVIKAAIFELVSVGTWRLLKIKRRRRVVVGLVPGTRPVPERVPLPVFSSRIDSSLATRFGGVTLHEFSAIARHLATWHTHTPSWVVRTLLEQLAAAGLVVQEERTVKVGQETMKVSTARRTPAGEALLAVSCSKTTQTPPVLAPRAPTRHRRAGTTIAGSGISLTEICDIFRLAIKEADNRDDWQDEFGDEFDFALGDSFNDAFHSAGANHGGDGGHDGSGHGHGGWDAGAHDGGGHGGP